jgi:hypothetical protein
MGKATGLKDASGKAPNRSLCKSNERNITKIDALKK